MLIIDRFEGDYAVIEADEEMIDIPRSELPEDAKEGDCLRLVIDREETAGRRKSIEERMNRLFKN